MNDAEDGMLDGSKHGAWTPDEDKLLAQYQQVHGNKWSVVANYIPGRTGQQCAQRWRHKVNPGIRKEKWSAEEDRQLASLVAEHGNRWADIAKHIPGRTDQQCMGRWRRHLDPNIRKCQWQTHEDELLKKKFSEVGPQWSNISKFLNGRTAQQCRARWFQLCPSEVFPAGAAQPNGAQEKVNWRKDRTERYRDGASIQASARQLLSMLGEQVPSSEQKGFRSNGRRSSSSRLQDEDDDMEELASVNRRIRSRRTSGTGVATPGKVSARRRIPPLQQSKAEDDDDELDDEEEEQAIAAIKAGLRSSRRSARATRQLSEDVGSTPKAPHVDARLSRAAHRRTMRAQPLPDCDDGLSPESCQEDLAASPGGDDNADWTWGRKGVRRRVTRPRRFIEDDGEDDSMPERTPVKQLAFNGARPRNEHWEYSSSQHDEADEDQILAAVALTEMAGGTRGCTVFSPRPVARHTETPVSFRTPKPTSALCDSGNIAALLSTPGKHTDVDWDATAKLLARDEPLDSLDETPVVVAMQTPSLNPLTGSPCFAPSALAPDTLLFTPSSRTLLRSMAPNPIDKIPFDLASGLTPHFSPRKAHSGCDGNASPTTSGKMSPSRVRSDKRDHPGAELSTPDDGGSAELGKPSATRKLLFGRDAVDDTDEPVKVSSSMLPPPAPSTYESPLKRSRHRRPAGSECCHKPLFVPSSTGTPASSGLPNTPACSPSVLASCSQAMSVDTMVAPPTTTSHAHAQPECRTAARSPRNTAGDSHMSSPEAGDTDMDVAHVVCTGTRDYRNKGAPEQCALKGTAAENAAADGVIVSDSSAGKCSGVSSQDLLRPNQESMQTACRESGSIHLKTQLESLVDNMFTF